VSAPAPELFTIGHSNHPIELFMDLLRRHEIEGIADVRSRPYSRFVPQFSKERLARALHEAGIGYLFLGRELGGKPVRGEAPSTAPDYASRVAEPAFRAGIERLLAAARERRLALLCRERDPLDCHRLHLICRYVKPRAGAIHHILADAGLEPQAATERRLLECAGGAALPLFGSADPLEQAYDRWWQGAR
jgi:uncharacterized protein (DUF488 family)